MNPADSYPSPPRSKTSRAFRKASRARTWSKTSRSRPSWFHGAEYIWGTVAEAQLGNRPFRINVDGDWHEARSLIIATGASARWLGLPNEQKLIGRGVSSCATCDGAFHRGGKIMVIGGGDSAMEEANFLTRFGAEITLVHRRDQFRASKIMLDRAKANPKIKFLTNTLVEDIYDVNKNTVTGVRLHDTSTDRTWDQEVSGFFLAIGHIPNTKPFAGQIDLDKDGYILSKAARVPISPACSTQATCRIAPIAKPSPPPEWAAWPRLKRSGF